MITLTDVGKSYGDEVTIGPVDLEIPAGGVTALVGPNGAGKSTLLTMIGRLLDIDEGAIEIAGYDVASTKSKDLAKIVSILRQENHFITRLTVRQLVGFGRFPYSQGRLTVADEEVISRSIDFLDLTALEGRYLDQLSGGQRQRAYVAMVLAQDTDYVLLDEPLNNLDMQHSVHMMRHLHRAAAELGRTVIVVLHDINFAGHYADRICAVKDGQVVEFGTPGQIMTDEVLTRVFDTEVQVIDGPNGPLAVYY
ncbi:ATP-binding cassette domain-containing protein [Janibacter indicus]|uniref:ATP-binding cassette domain-containing protein n=1 Tax=Janibacter indicus TaxID=857417 RepID=A0A7L9J0L5_9MICO|nr:MULTISPECIES: ATP-binding cassette domain-containing protein [Janibacter]QNF94064.1 ATP-binding cassette domain-containing protein [Janibacter sp. YB324]QOK22667.1 ATP-binding cassette domain-containing protein [Janibacter indicus]